MIFNLNDLRTTILQAKKAVPGCAKQPFMYSFFRSIDMNLGARTWSLAHVLAWSMGPDVIIADPLSKIHKVLQGLAIVFPLIVDNT